MFLAPSKKVLPSMGFKTFHSRVFIIYLVLVVSGLAICLLLSYCSFINSDLAPNTYVFVPPNKIFKAIKSSYFVDLRLDNLHTDIVYDLSYLMVDPR